MVIESEEKYLSIWYVDPKEPIRKLLKNVLLPQRSDENQSEKGTWNLDPKISEFLSIFKNWLFTY